MMMAGSSSNDCSSFDDEGVVEEESYTSIPEGGATDTVEEVSCIKKSREDAPNGATGDDHTPRRKIEALVPLVERGIPDKHTRCGKRREFVGCCGTKVRLT